jgi:hypothetical protein
MDDFQLNTLYKTKQFCVLRKNTHTCFDIFSQWPCGLRCGFVVPRLLRFGFESRRGRGWPSLVIVVCQVQVFVSGWSIAQRSTTKCDNEASKMRRPWPTRGCCIIEKTLDANITVVRFDVLTSYISCRRGPNTEKCDVMRNVTIHQSQHSCQG